MAGLVFLGDDFTGASDSLATYARLGVTSRLVLRPEAAPGDLDALGLPTDLRSLVPERALAELDRLWPAIAAASPQVLHFKVCSTFDSAPAVGSIGAVTGALIDRFRPDVVAVIGGQPSLGRYCLFGHLFARGPDGNVHRIDRHPVMAHHPVTPMEEADLRRHLAAQDLDGLTLVPFTQLDETEAVVETLKAGPVLFDMASEADGLAIARALRQAGGRQLLIGASSVAEILAGSSERSTPPSALPAAPSGGVLMFAGSRSANTRAQVEQFSGTRLALTPGALRDGSALVQAAGLLEAGAPLLVHLEQGADYGLSPGGLADASAGFVAQLLDRCPVACLGLAGGDTSSRICARLGLDALAYDRAMGAGVCICVASHQDARRDGMRIMLKGGQMGQPDLFDRFAGVAAGQLA
ncbi:hypothetical protein KU6B_39540 [Mameliella alba]|uniref:four-carbon acid sugar kinase family protein n=1 Tax=Mameliella alba TaxID=561184 RepID=UPI0013E486E9|nr:four-carbon acid sugar kinase family protein [Mameliella alba]BBU57689.1 hypothetical protein KU6B_39540 [Mameliella alba]